MDVVLEILFAGYTNDYHWIRTWSYLQPVEQQDAMMTCHMYTILNATA
jgi:hypothetical protein